LADPQQTDTVTCTINGAQVTVPKGTRIIEAAERIGVGIANYCYHPGLSAPAMCRMCLVEVEGAPKLAPACVACSSARATPTCGPERVPGGGAPPPAHQPGRLALISAGRGRFFRR
jgi:predicted molibdopterin-dependent oxidoreductase YjgC